MSAFSATRGEATSKLKMTGVEQVLDLPLTGKLCSVKSSGCRDEAVSPLIKVGSDPNMGMNIKRYGIQVASYKKHFPNEAEASACI